MTQPAVRTLAAGWCDPELVFLAHVGNSRDMRADAWPSVVWLDAGPDANDGFSYVGLDIEEPLTRWSDLRAAATVATRAGGEPQVTRDGQFTLGWVGWLPYDTGVRWQDPSRAEVASGREACFSRVNTVIEFDHARHEMTVVTCLGDAATARALETIARASASETTTVDHDERVGEMTGSWRDTDEEYLAHIDACRAEIAAGNAYQLCLTNSYRVDATFDMPSALAVYRRLRRSNPSHHGAFLCLDGTALLSSSPEIFLTVTADGRATTKPIKGTRPRGTTAEEDRMLRDELAQNVKERAENVMIVDLMRNDLGRVAQEGTTRVDSLLTVESYANVHQLVSTVSVQLKPECTALDAVEACFPAGSMTGAPKISAMRILSDLEGGERGIYSGAFGYFGDDGAAQLAMVIRSLVIDHTGVSLGSGGGITIDSDPQEELAEMHLKAAPLLRALNGDDTPVI